LPSPRLISNKLLNGSTASTKGQKHSCSLLLAQWAQFIYEDIARIGTNRIFSSGNLIRLMTVFVIQLRIFSEFCFNSNALLCRATSWMFAYYNGYWWFAL